MLSFLLSMVETEEERTFIEQFYFEHKDKLLGYAYNQARATKLSNDRAYAEELVQETFVRVIRKIKIFMAMERDKSRSYAFKTLANIINERLRKKKNEASSFDVLEDDVFVSQTNIETEFINHLTVEAIKAAARQLPPKQRDVFFMWCVFESSHNEIAETLDISVSYSQTLLDRAKKGIRKAINERG